MQRISISLDEGDYEALVARARDDVRSISSTASLLIHRALGPPVQVPEPKPSKSPPPKEQPVIVERKIGNQVVVDHPWLAIRGANSCQRRGCPDPRNRKAHL